jgi:hypothetical protein
MQLDRVGKYIATMYFSAKISMRGQHSEMVIFEEATVLWLVHVYLDLNGDSFSCTAMTKYFVSPHHGNVL